MRIKITITFSLLLGTIQPVFAGIDKFSVIDRIENWEIERRIDSEDQSIECRASVPSYYQWFGGRVRITTKGDLIVPDEFNKTKLVDRETVIKIKSAVERCNSDLIYKLSTET